MVDEYEKSDGFEGLRRDLRIVLSDWKKGEKYKFPIKFKKDSIHFNGFDPIESKESEIKNEVFDDDCPICDMKREGINSNVLITHYLWSIWLERHNKHKNGQN